MRHDTDLPPRRPPTWGNIKSPSRPVAKSRIPPDLPARRPADLGQHQVVKSPRLQVAKAPAAARAADDADLKTLEQSTGNRKK